MRPSRSTWRLKGVAHFYKDKGKHLVTVKTEHKAMLDTMRELERDGFEVTYLDVEDNGLLDFAKLRAALRPDTILVSVMFVNNEIGVIQDIAAIGELTRSRGIVFHVDAAQATGKVPIDLAQLQGRSDVVLGAQDLRPERGRCAVRAPQAARADRGANAWRRPRARDALGHAANAPDRRHGRGVPLAREEMATENERIRMLRDRLWTGISQIEEVYLNGDLTRRVPHNLNVSFNFVEGESLIMAMKDVAVSSGSACTSASPGALLCAARARPQRRACAQLDPLYGWPLYDSGGNRLYGRSGQAAGRTAARNVSAVGDVQRMEST